MFDSDTLRPVIIAMTLYLVLSTVVPKVVTKPPKIDVVDKLIMYLISQKGAMMSGVILIGIIVYLTNYINFNM